MGSANSDLAKIPYAENLMRETGFAGAHLVRLYERFQSLDKGNKGHLSVQDFANIKELAMNPICDLIIGAFFSSGQETLDFPSFVRILAHFRPVDKNRPKEPNSPDPINSRINKLKFAFQLYDQDKDGKISRRELLQVLQAMLESQVTQEQLESIVDRTIQEADLDNDDAISFEEFRKNINNKNICRIPENIQDWTIHGLWKDEWYKHGTCAGCVENMSSPFLYFKSVLQLRLLFDVDLLLAKADIKPSCNISYKYDDLHGALEPLLGDNFVLQCVKDEKEREAWLQLKILVSKNMTLGCHTAEELKSSKVMNTSSGHPCPHKHHHFLFTHKPQESQRALHLKPALLCVLSDGGF
ncbi:Calcineurin B homologous protein 2 [Bagarius yarrelli]|uniref:Calcineurin B homologous protein 2 n=1 Tax=Bagarius yarrelli TaxID=175774 RepID=A0A556U705_BAGYA|nr:Calcineurin B homologous protein 2 [Bagarius yarrelli]